MCGALASRDKLAVEMGNEASGGSPEIHRGTATALRTPSKTGLKQTITVVVSTGLLVCTLFYFASRGPTLGKTLAAVPSVAATSPQPNTRSASAPMNGAEKSRPENGDFPSAKVRPGKISNTKYDDPVELWSRVRQGSTGAEVALARLYLQGIAVSQSCEQAHVLLMAASQKRSKPAESLLAGDYAQQCQ
jgi:hypothetical protein